MTAARASIAGIPILLLRVSIATTGIQLSTMVAARIILMTLMPLLVLRLVFPSVKFSSHVGSIVIRGIVPIVKSRIVV